MLLPSTTHRDDLLEVDMALRKKACFIALTGRFEVRESSSAVAARQAGHTLAYRVDYGFVDTVDANIRAVESRAMTADDRALLRAQVSVLTRDMRYFRSMASSYEREVLELIIKDGPRCGLHLNVDKTKVFWQKEDSRSRLAGIFPPNIARPLHGVKLLGGSASVDFDFYNELVMKRVAKTIGLMDAISKINDPQCELFLLRSCTGISKLYFTMRTCPPRLFESAQRSFNMALRSSLERIVTASGLGFDDWKWRLATLPFAFGGLSVYSTGDVLNYAFLASRL
nr:hypothetical protein [Tanacetum cinerariifolium]GEW73752.1 hypothetical protein [Tanacetum cinerariifolium]